MPIQLLSAGQRPIRFPRAVAITVLSLALPLSSYAQQTKAPAPKPPAAATTSSAPQKLPSFENMTCGDLLFMLGDEQQAQDSTYLILWAYGLKTGVNGADLKKHPLTPEGVKAFVGELYDTCKTKSDTKVLDVLTARPGSAR